MIDRILFSPDVVRDLLDEASSLPGDCYFSEEFEDTKGVIRIRGRTDNTMAKRKTSKGQTTIYKTLHIKLKIE